MRIHTAMEGLNCAYIETGEQTYWRSDTRKITQQVSSNYVEAEEGPRRSEWSRRYYAHLSKYTIQIVSWVRLLKSVCINSSRV